MGLEETNTLTQHGGCQIQESSYVFVLSYEKEIDAVVGSLLILGRGLENYEFVMGIQTVPYRESFGLITEGRTRSNISHAVESVRCLGSGKLSPQQESCWLLLGDPALQKKMDGALKTVFDYYAA